VDAKSFVRQRGALERHVNHVGARSLATFANGVGHFTRFAQTDANLAQLVAGNYQGAEAESATALHDLGRAVDEHDLLGQFMAGGVELGFAAAGAAARLAGKPTRATALAPGLERLGGGFGFDWNWNFVRHSIAPG